MEENQAIVSEKKPVILIVDDNSKNLQVLGNIIRVKNWKIGVAVSGRLALQMVDVIHPDLILLDIMMPDINGFEVCRKLKASDETKDIPIIFLTAKTEMEDVAKGFRFGASDYVTKPFNSIELLARITTHLELKKAWDSLEKIKIEHQEVVNQVDQLSNLLPICSQCKKIRDNKDYWRLVEEYIDKNQKSLSNKSICKECKENAQNTNNSKNK
ncbi:MAG: response regulator [Candidatus Hatepunaea meridiana]|nr:response regulator [Candidatus Hatepunaea meridiana]